MSAWEICALAIMVAAIILLLPLPIFLDVVLPTMKQNKQRKCMHMWRRMDVEYMPYMTEYHYRCEKCGKEKKLDEGQAKRFEEDFMSDW